MPTGCCGETAGHTGPAWNFPGLPKLAVIIHQRGYLHDPPLDATQTLHSVSRESPMTVFVDPNSPIHVAVNSPQPEVWMNDGYINLWVRVNSQ